MSLYILNIDVRNILYFVNGNLLIEYLLKDIILKLKLRNLS